MGKLALSVPTPKADVSSAVTLGSYDELESRLFPLLQHLRGAGSAGWRLQLMHVHGRPDSAQADTVRQAVPIRYPHGHL